jgi:pantothenate synthetase
MSRVKRMDVIGEIDYLNLCDPVTLGDVDALSGETLQALIVRVGKTRPIDCCVVGKTVTQ